MLATAIAIAAVCRSRWLQFDLRFRELGQRMAKAQYDLNDEELQASTTVHKTVLFTTTRKSLQIK